MENPFDAYDLAREAISSYLTAARGRAFLKTDFYIPSKRAPVSYPLAKLKSSSGCAGIEKCLNEGLLSKPVTILGADAVKSFETADGLLLIHFSSMFYDTLMRHTIEILEEPADVQGVSRAHYALNRMMMLSRKPLASCPDDSHVQRALWTAFGITDRLCGKRALRLRLENASDALLTMTHHLPPKDRPQLFERCGGAARCAARLLYFGLKTSIGGDSR